MSIVPKSLSQQVRRQLVDVNIASAAAADATASFAIFRAPFAAVVKAIRLIPATAITGADTNSATSEVLNVGTAGAGTTSLGSVAWESGTDGAALSATDVTLSTTEGALELAAGDVLTYKRTKVGTGLALPALHVQIEYEITDQLNRSY